VKLSYFVWSQNGTKLRGLATNAPVTWLDGELVFPIAFPGSPSVTEVITLQSSASEQGSLETFKNVKLYLTGDPADIAVVQGLWPTLGNAYTPARPEMNGGLEISFDGSTFTRFSNSVGLESDPSTWITLPAISIGQNGADGVLGAYDTAAMYVRYAVPSVASVYKTFNLQLAADADII
jgi:hypothetical protein